MQVSQVTVPGPRLGSGWLRGLPHTVTFSPSFNWWTLSLGRICAVRGWLYGGTERVSVRSDQLSPHVPERALVRRLLDTHDAVARTAVDQHEALVAPRLAALPFPRVLAWSGAARIRTDVG